MWVLFPAVQFSSVAAMHDKEVLFFATASGGIVKWIVTCLCMAAAAASPGEECPWTTSTCAGRGRNGGGGERELGRNTAQDEGVLW